MAATRQQDNSWLAAELEHIRGGSDELIAQWRENERLTAKLNVLQECRHTPIQPASQAQPPMDSSIDASLAYVHRQQLNSIQVPMFEGKLDLHLVSEFMQNVELMAVNMGMAPKETTGHGNKTIQLAV
ncbi:hypothetical protein BDD12DRAFT_878076 [Trichophaea hybrida]|nr:hypothetical protein BDD12DRAFT_878076 [Trichophaea hybrida]